MNSGAHDRSLSTALGQPRFARYTGKQAGAPSLTVLALPRNLQGTPASERLGRGAMYFLANDLSADGLFPLHGRSGFSDRGRGAVTDQ